MNADIEEQAFHDIDHHLQLATECTLEIEILPSALCPPGPPSIQCEGHCLGIPKTLLVPAFKHAVKILALGQERNVPQRQSGQHKDNCTQKYRATAVVLLIAPEHLTAANIRKRYLVQLEQQRSPDLSEALRYEIKFLDSLFTSPLHRHTKSPTLWSHRRWLVTHFDHDLQPLLRTLFKMPLRHGDVVQKDEASAEELGNRDLVSSLLKQEFEVVQKAGQQHPRNYVAYDYMRYITTLCVSHGADLDRMPAISVSENPSDTSSVSFVEFRLHLLDHSSSASQATDIRTRLVHHVIQDTIEKALQYRWRSEAVWSLVRVALSSTNAVGLPERQRRKFLEALKEWLETYVLDEKHDSLEEHTLGDVRAIAKTRLHGQVEKTVQWIEKWWEA